MPLTIGIIGAGPSGLVTLKYLLAARKQFPSFTDELIVRVFESRHDLGGVFRYQTYENSELVSSKYLTAFSDHRFPIDAPDFVAPEEYIRYLEEYVRKHDLKRHITFGVNVEHVQKLEDGRHTIYYTKPYSERDVNPANFGEWHDSIVGQVEVEWDCDAVVVCSGLNRVPREPQIRRVNGHFRNKYEIIHSHIYKGADFFSAKGAVPRPITAVILGAGETAMDISFDAVTHPDVERVVMCNRDGFLIAPKITPEPVILGRFGKPYPGKRPNKPVDTTIASLFDTMYVPGILQRGPWLWFVYDRWLKYVFFLISGTTQGIDQWVGGLPPRRRYADAIFLVKSSKAVPYMSAGQRKGLLNAIRSFLINVPIPDTGNKRIEVKGWPSHMENGTLYIPVPGSETEFEEVKPDRVVYATGYQTVFPFLEEGQYPTLEEASVRGIYRNIEEGFAYIGFVRPSIGAIPPLAELQAQLWVYRFLQSRLPVKLLRKVDVMKFMCEGTAGPRAGAASSESAIAPYELDYALHARGSWDLFSTKRGVDHESYAYQLALDMGAAPTFTHMVKYTSWKCVFTWAMGPNFNTKFRLVGPWANPEEAIPVMEGELFNVVKRTGGGFFFVTYTLIPFILFGFLSLVIMGLQQLYRVPKFIYRVLKPAFVYVAGLNLLSRGDDSPETQLAAAARHGQPLTGPRVVSYFG